jgi:hypothetical protein
MVLQTMLGRCGRLAIGGLHYVSDIGPAAWIRDRLHPFAQDVGSVIPEGFDDYARVFHPAYRDGQWVRWHEIAQANGRTVHPEMQFGNISGSWHSRQDPHLWNRSPRPGTLPLELARALVSSLRPHTKTPELCWFAVWVGWGSDQPSSQLPRLVIPQREYYLASGSVDDAVRGVYGESSGYQSPSMWWPHDRSWFVSTEVDLAYTYLGGTRECIAAVIAHPEIEVLRARPGDRITWDSDTINPSPGPPS